MTALQFLKGNLGEKKNDKRDSGHFGAKAPTGKLPTKAPPMEPLNTKQPPPAAPAKDNKEEMDWVTMISGAGGGGGPAAVAKPAAYVQKPIEPTPSANYLDIAPLEKAPPPDPFASRSKVFNGRDFFENVFESDQATEGSSGKYFNLTFAHDRFYIVNGNCTIAEEISYAFVQWVELNAPLRIATIIVSKIDWKTSQEQQVPYHFRSTLVYADPFRVEAFRAEWQRMQDMEASMNTIEDSLQPPSPAHTPAPQAAPQQAAPAKTAPPPAATPAVSSAPSASPASVFNVPSAASPAVSKQPLTSVPAAAQQKSPRSMAAMAPLPGLSNLPPPPPLSAEQLAQLKPPPGSTAPPPSIVEPAASKQPASMIGARQLKRSSITMGSLDLAFNSYIDINKDKLAPTKESLDKTVSQMYSASTLSKFLETKLQDPTWQTQLKTLYLMEAFIAASNPAVVAYFATVQKPLSDLTQSPQAAMREMATKVLTQLRQKAQPK